MTNTLLEKITFLNQTTLDSLIETSDVKIIEHFTETGLDILGADFGFSWWKVHGDDPYTLIYTSPDLPYTPKLPREHGGNFVAEQTQAPVFIQDVMRKNYEKEYDVSPYMESYVIIPIMYKKYMYGSIVLCYKKKHVFSEEDRGLAISLGNTTAQTITTRQFVEKEYKSRILSEKQEARFRALIENSYEIITHINNEGFILYVSPSIKKILGVDVVDVIGKNIADLIYHGNNIKTLEYVHQILKNPNDNHIIEFSFRKADGSILFLESISADMSGNPHMEGIIVNIRDVTGRKMMEFDKETKRLLVEEKLKVEYLADATHELRTPLAVIKGNVDLGLLDKGKNPKSALKAIDAEVTHLAGILSDLALLTSQGGQYKHKMAYEEIVLADLIGGIAKRLKYIAPKKTISIGIRISKNIHVTGDKVYLEKLFSNLIRNALTYGSIGGWIKITAVQNESGTTIRVQDNGVGIAEEDLPHIFNRFYRVDKSHSSRGKRTGLGLAIAKWVADVHKGTISVESTLGKGSTFTVFLPINTPVN